MSLSSSSGSRRLGAGNFAGETEVRRKWCPLLELLSADSDAADGAPVSLMIVAHVTYRASLLVRALRRWRNRTDAVVERRRCQACLAVQWYARRRVFLFFRAWQWRYGERWQSRVNNASAQKHCVAAALRRALTAWKVCLRTKRELEAQVNTMSEGVVKALLLRCWLAWHHRALQCIAYKKVSSGAARWRRQSCWMAWRHVTWERRARRLHMAGLLLHLPAAWTEIHQLPNMKSGSDCPMPCAHDCLLYESVASDSLAMRFYWIRWLGESARRRGIRLRRYEAAVAHIEHHRDGRAMACGYQRWLMRTVSTLHSRRTTLVARCRYFYKWLLFAERQALCERRWRDVARRCKSSVMQYWRERTLRRQRCNQHIAQAGEFCEDALRNRLLPLSFYRWMQRVRSRREYRALEQAAYHHRTELVRKLTVNNLLSSVLLTFWQPSREESLSTAESQPPRAKCTVTMTRTAADAYTTPTSPAACCVDPEVRTVSEAFVENDPVEALRRRLVSRSAAIPLVGRMTHVDAFTPPIRAAAASAGSGPAACVKAHVTSPSTASGTLAEDASPSPHLADHTPTVSLNTSVTTVRVAAQISVAEGKNLLLAYRAMLASASAEREEAGILRKKLRLYSAQRQNRAGSVTRIQQEEAQLQHRLLVLRQRDLDRQATRAQVLQLAKQLEVVLRPSDPCTGLAVEGGE
ncbi:putative leucine-rich repeat protein (LRRP) [Trypanosoma rangeli]|uniref:Putative leucine-rich repeat protein (LRRP) n=1 Tax=Trypanosoma rangeli TaxID=5698 RepID=A0A422NQU1_TRYRA|nr:putative leucine-rich repeat protein (LRRP) [Trypanosoma rangeli]RNF07880.1 putative leucine-rich repeat protein (LRRP) [Trypanosoma rangeli]|eukprot:RNF07880.1 putative leucine-rich repeat protein (LRRP) [Trypanosoma rangeli]